MPGNKCVLKCCKNKTNSAPQLCDYHQPLWENVVEHTSINTHKYDWKKFQDDMDLQMKQKESIDAWK